MAKSNREKIGDTITLFRDGIKPFVERELHAQYGNDWKKQVAEMLRFDPGNDWDTWAYLAAMWESWNLVFRNTLGHAERSIVSELRDVRNKWAHEKTFSSDDTYRAMDSMEVCLCGRLTERGPVATLNSPVYERHLNDYFAEQRLFRWEMTHTRESQSYYE